MAAEGMNDRPIEAVSDPKEVDLVGTHGSTIVDGVKWDYYSVDENGKTLGGKFEKVNGVMVYNGVGIIVGPDIRYTGDIRNGVPEGKWTQVFSDGGSYTGGFKDGMRHGAGVNKYARGTVHIGEYKNDVPSGNGELQFKSGTKIEGNFIDGVTRWNGVLRFNEGIRAGEVYAGEFSDGGLAIINEVEGYSAVKFTGIMTRQDGTKKDLRDYTILGVY